MDHARVAESGAHDAHGQSHRPLSRRRARPLAFTLRNLVTTEGFEPPRYRFGSDGSVRLSYVVNAGAPGRIRTRVVSA